MYSAAAPEDPAESAELPAAVVSAAVVAAAVVEDPPEELPPHAERAAISDKLTKHANAFFIYLSSLLVLD